MWRNTAKPAKIGFGPIKVDAKLSFFLLVFVFHIREWTAIMAGTLILIFWTIEKFGLSLSATLAFLRMTAGGWERTVSRPWRQRLRAFH